MYVNFTASLINILCLTVMWYATCIISKKVHPKGKLQTHIQDTKETSTISSSSRLSLNVDVSENYFQEFGKTSDCEIKVNATHLSVL